MDKKDAFKVLKILKLAYPSFYRDYTADELDDTAAIWATMLSDYNHADVAKAVQATIATSKYPPTISDVTERIQLMYDRSLTELEAWSYVNRAIRDSTYHARESWEKLPAEVQRVVSPDLLRSWAMAEEDTAVVQSHFSRCFRAAQARKKEVDMLPSSVREYMAKISGESMKMIGEKTL